MTELPQDEPVGRDEPGRNEVDRRERARVTAAGPSWGMRALQRAQAELDRALAHDLGLRALDYTAMSHLLAADPAIGPVELAARLGISTGSGTEVADRLERAGHLHRRRTSDDRRRVVLEPDESSVAAIVATIGPLLADLDRLAATFSDPERDAITRFLDQAAALTRTFATTLARDRP